MQLRAAAVFIKYEKTRVETRSESSKNRTKKKNTPRKKKNNREGKKNVAAPQKYHPQKKPNHHQIRNATVKYRHKAPDKIHTLARQAPRQQPHLEESKKTKDMRRAVYWRSVHRERQGQGSTKQFRRKNEQAPVMYRRQHDNARKSTPWATNKCHFNSSVFPLSTPE